MKWKQLIRKVNSIETRSCRKQTNKTKQKNNNNNNNNNNNDNNSKIKIKKKDIFNCI